MALSGTDAVLNVAVKYLKQYKYHEYSTLGIISSAGTNAECEAHLISEVATLGKC